MIIVEIIYHHCQKKPICGRHEPYCWIQSMGKWIPLIVDEQRKLEYPIV